VLDSRASGGPDRSSDHDAFVVWVGRSRKSRCTPAPTTFWVAGGAEVSLDTVRFAAALEVDLSAR